MTRMLFVFTMVMPLLLSGCLQEQTIVNIASAENIRKTTDGRIFVSGKEALFEIVVDDATAYQAKVISDKDGCTYYGGLAQLHDWLFVACDNFRGLAKPGIKFEDSGRLLAYSLKHDYMVTVAQLSHFQLVNGLDAWPEENSIFIADEDFLGHGGVTKVSLDFSSGEPVLLYMQQNWIGREQGVYAANGVRWLNGSLFLTDIGVLKRVDMMNGEPQTAKILYRKPTVLDDLAPYCNGVLVADFINGTLIYVSADGKQKRESARGLHNPSAMLPDATPLFPAGTMLITETFGLIPNTGNQLASLDSAQLNMPCD